MRYTYLQYEYRGKWIHADWCNRLFATDEMHFDRVRNAVFGIAEGSFQPIYPEGYQRLRKRERDASRQAIALYASLGLMDPREVI